MEISDVEVNPRQGLEETSGDVADSADPLKRNEARFAERKMRLGSVVEQNQIVGQI